MHYEHKGTDEWYINLQFPSMDLTNAVAKFIING
jgi:hypothetical protein